VLLDLIGFGGARMGSPAARMTCDPPDRPLLPPITEDILRFPL
jgi:hypothetical protein